ncbi:hypothetical protein CWO90_32930 [Bradyrhizobium sp. Leo121]|nr:hypothetical protein CWO90_32930 [Bradyrhizobium sp. Leo121]
MVRDAALRLLTMRVSQRYVLEHDEIRSNWRHVGGALPLPDGERSDRIVRCDPGEGDELHRGTVTAHPALRADLSLWERWTIAVTPIQPNDIML